ncbi:MAG: cell division protein FtsZ [Candidatus Micrarchaeia archaeon]
MVESLKQIVDVPLSGGMNLQNFDDLTEDDKELLKFYESSKPKIYVLGMGGSGSNTVNRLSQIGIKGANIVAMNTDVQHLLHIKADKKILLGKTTTRGIGAGSDPEVGEAAATESLEDIKRAISDASLVFVTCGLGGGTGTGSAPVAAKVAKEMGALVVAVVTLPFTSEGEKRRQNAMKGLEKLKKSVDTIIVIPNDKLLAVVPDLPLDAAFRVSDEVLAKSVKGIAELITVSGLINLDLADLKTILKDGGYSMIGVGESSVDSSYDERALLAASTALKSPLLDVDISTSNRAIINVVGGEDMTLREAELIAREVSKQIAKDSHIIWGARVDKSMKRSQIQVLVVLVGVNAGDMATKPDKVKVAEELEEIDLNDLDLAV